VAAGLSATSTHDTKRGEDVRARSTCSEMPEPKAAALKWRMLNRKFKRRWAALARSNEEYLLYQTPLALALRLRSGRDPGRAPPLSSASALHDEGVRDRSRYELVESRRA
jgi:hypothetical protein